MRSAPAPLIYNARGGDACLHIHTHAFVHVRVCVRAYVPTHADEVSELSYRMRTYMHASVS